MFERAFGPLGSLAEFLGPENRDQPAILPDVATNGKAMKRAVDVFATGGDHRGQRALG